MTSDAIKHIHKYIKIYRPKSELCSVPPSDAPLNPICLINWWPSNKIKVLDWHIVKKELDKFKTVFLLHFKNPFKLHDCIKLPLYKHNLKIDKAFLWHKYPYKCVLSCMCFQLIPSLNFYFRVSWSFLLIFQSVALAFQMPFK